MKFWFKISVFTEPQIHCSTSMGKDDVEGEDMLAIIEAKKIFHRQQNSSPVTFFRWITHNWKLLAQEIAMIIIWNTHERKVKRALKQP
jgi:hypothetical protein